MKSRVCQHQTEDLAAIENLEVDTFHSIPYRRDGLPECPINIYTTGEWSSVTLCHVISTAVGTGVLCKIRDNVDLCAVNFASILSISVLNMLAHNTTRQVLNMT